MTGQMSYMYMNAFNALNDNTSYGDECTCVWDRCILKAEEYDMLMSKRKSSFTRTSSRRRGRAKNIKPSDRERVDRKMMRRADERNAQLLAKKRNRAAKRDRLARQRYMGYSYRDDAGSSYTCTTETYNDYDEILPASQLGIEEGSNYQRLLEILEGGEILPEDYDLLLMLDESNVRSTIDEADLSGMPIRVISSGGGKDQPEISRSELGDECCLVCLQPFAQMDSGQQLRQLPCDHLYCKDCIDSWLSSRSKKCPDLSCYWSSST